MRPKASVQVAQSTQHGVAKCLPTTDKASRLHGWRDVVAWGIDQPSEIYRNLLDSISIQIIGFWREPEALDLIEGDVLTRHRRMHAALPGLCEPLREGTA